MLVLVLVLGPVLMPVQAIIDSYSTGYIVRSRAGANSNANASAGAGAGACARAGMIVPSLVIMRVIMPALVLVLVPVLALVRIAVLM